MHVAKYTSPMDPMGILGRVLFFWGGGFSKKFMGPNGAH